MRNNIVSSKMICPKCASKDLSIIEISNGANITWEQRDGKFDRDDGNLECGDPVHVLGHCAKCQHRWKVRKALQITDIIIPS
jgi:Zn finger protein HypA/HybF involved in hydrogenase expression